MKKVVISFFALTIAFNTLLFGQDIETIKKHLPSDLHEIAAEYKIPVNFLETDAPLMELILRSRSIETKEEKQSWFDLLYKMNDTQIEKLRDILEREKRKAALIDNYGKSDLDLRSFLSYQAEECSWIKQTEPNNQKKLEQCEFEMGIKFAEYLIEKSESYQDEDEKMILKEEAFSFYESFLLKERKNYIPDYSNAIYSLNNFLFDYGEEDDQGAIRNYIEVIDKNKRFLRVLDALSYNLASYERRKVQTLGNLSYYYLFSRNFNLAKKHANEALSIDPKQTWIKTNLGHAVLFTEGYKEAMRIYESIKEIEYAPREVKIKDLLIEDIDALEKAGIFHEKFDKIRKELMK